jgi:hypothetical protein
MEKWGVPIYCLLLKAVWSTIVIFRPCVQFYLIEKRWPGGTPDAGTPYLFDIGVNGKSGPSLTQ